jgi:4-hydroxy-3-polyprenylbenzoate decarboxylase
MRVVIGMTGASGSAFGVRFLKECPGEKFLVMSRWARSVLHQETGLTIDDLAPYAKKVFSNEDLNAPFASGSNPFDAFVVLPCSVTTLGRIAAGLGDTLISRTAEVALKERRRLVLCVRETPLSGIALENCLKLSREGAVIMPVSPPFYARPQSLDDLYSGFASKIMGVLGVPVPTGWRAEELD